MSSRCSARRLTEAESAPRPLPVVEGIDGKGLADLVEAARRHPSDALVVWKDGKVVVDEACGKPRAPIEAMSMTKSVVNLAIGLWSGARKI